MAKKNELMRKALRMKLEVIRRLWKPASMEISSGMPSQRFRDMVLLHKIDNCIDSLKKAH